MKLSSQLVLFFVCLLLSFCVLFDFFSRSVLYVLLCFVNSAICFYQISMYPNEPFSIHKLVHIFILFFFVFANALQFGFDEVVVSLPISFGIDEYIVFQFIVFLILFLIFYVYDFIRKRLFFNNFKKVHTFYRVNEKKLIRLSLFSVGCTVLCYVSNPLLLIFRGVADDVADSALLEGPIALIMGKFVRPMSWACYVLARLTNSGRKTSCILFFLLLLGNFPLSMARNAVGMFWLPVVILNFPIFRKKYLFPIGMVFALLVLFPVLDSFRNFNGSVNFEISFYYLVSMNFDASQMFMAVMKWDFITMGRQLLGTLFFWVPRSIWPDKPGGSGWELATQLGVFPNVSMPFFAEGYVNFGLFGVFLFTFILSFYIAKLDHWFSINTRDRLNDGYYLLLIGAIIYIMRGDLMSSTAYTVGILCSYWFVKKVCIFK